MKNHRICYIILAIISVLLFGCATDFVVHDSSEAKRQKASPEESK